MSDDLNFELEDLVEGKQKKSWWLRVGIYLLILFVVCLFILLYFLLRGGDSTADHSKSFSLSKSTENSYVIDGVSNSFYDAGAEVAVYKGDIIGARSDDISQKDVLLIQQYLDGSIEELPENMSIGSLNDQLYSEISIETEKVSYKEMANFVELADEKIQNLRSRNGEYSDLTDEQLEIDVKDIKRKKRRYIRRMKRKSSGGYETVRQAITAEELEPIFKYWKSQNLITAPFDATINISEENQLTFKPEKGKLANFECPNKKCKGLKNGDEMKIINKSSNAEMGTATIVDIENKIFYLDVSESAKLANMTIK